VNKLGHRRTAAGLNDVYQPIDDGPTCGATLRGHQPLVILAPINGWLGLGTDVLFLSTCNPIHARFLLDDTIPLSLDLTILFSACSKGPSFGSTVAP
jgi:hypothetical protein